MSAPRGDADPAYASARDGFDQLADRYDDDMRRQAPIIDRFRRVLHDAMDRYIAPGATVLEIGCGSGAETLFLALSGRSVIATDVSPKMVRVTRSRLEAAGLAHRLRTAVGSGADVSARLLDEGLRIDAVISSLGPLNCEPDLEELGASLARLLPSGAPLVLSPMARHCPWEVLALAARGRPREAVRRLGAMPVPVPVGTATVPVWYFTPGEFIRRLGPAFRRLELRGLGVFLPPPWLHRLDVVPGLLPVLDRLDDRLAHLLPFSALGDHSLVVLARR